MEKIIIKSLQELDISAQKISKTIKAPSVFTFEGDLGAGKTTLCAAIIRHLVQKDIIVTSPTFNIMQSYDSSFGTIYHFDLYRLNNPEELYELGIEEAMDTGICLIEWPQIARHLLPKYTQSIKLDIISENERLLTINQSN